MKKKRWYGFGQSCWRKGMVVVALEEDKAVFSFWQGRWWGNGYHRGFGDGGSSGVFFVWWMKGLEAGVFGQMIC